MAIWSGKDAWVSGGSSAITHVQSWTVTEAVTAQRHSHSAVPSATDVPAGVTNWTGSISGVGAEPALFPTGTDIVVGFVIKNTVPKISMAGTILVESLTINIDRSTRAPISWTAAFGVQGALTKNAAGSADAATSSAENGKDLDVVIDGSSLVNGSYATCVQSCQLVFRRPPQTYVCDGLTYRVPGNLEADISVSILDSNPELLPIVENTLSVVEVEVNAAGDNWSLDSVRWLGISGLTANRTTNAVIGFTASGQVAFPGGGIIGPSAVAYYP